MPIKEREMKGQQCSASRRGPGIYAGATSRWNRCRTWPGSVAGALLVRGGDTRWPNLPLSIWCFCTMNNTNLIVAVVKEAVEVLLLLLLLQLLLSWLLMVMMMLDWCLSVLFCSFYFQHLFFSFLFFSLKGNQLDKHQLPWLTSHEYALLSGIHCKISMYLWEINLIWFDLVCFRDRGSVCVEWRYTHTIE